MRPRMLPVSPRASVPLSSIWPSAIARWPILPGLRTVRHIHTTSTNKNSAGRSEMDSRRNLMSVHDRAQADADTAFVDAILQRDRLIVVGGLSIVIAAAWLWI